MTEQLDGQMSLFDQDTWFGKMSQEPYQAPEKDTQGKTSKPSSRKSSGSSTPKLPTCLCLRKVGGNIPGVYTMRWEGGALLGDFTMHSFGESPSEENVSRLSQILEDAAHPKYYLSAKACNGILARAARRGKELPEVLKTALENQIRDVG